MTGDAAFIWLVTVFSILAVYVLAALWLRSALRRWWVRNSGCRACAYRKAGPCACTRKCVNPDCKGGEAR